MCDIYSRERRTEASGEAQAEAVWLKVFFPIPKRRVQALNDLGPMMDSPQRQTPWSRQDVDRQTRDRVCRVTLDRSLGVALLACREVAFLSPERSWPVSFSPQRHGL